MYKKITVFMGAVLLTLGILFTFFSRVMTVKADSSATVYHRHTGSSSGGGGCYGNHKTGSEPCNASLTDIWFNGVDYSYKCNRCGNTWHYIYQLNGIRCPYDYNYDYYDCNCGKGDAALATFSCSPSTTDWVREVQLNASVDILDSSFGVSSYLWNGQTGGSSCTVTSNGTYTLQLTGNDNSDTSASVSVMVNNIDTQAPMISSFAPDSSGWTTAATLNVAAADSLSGLHESAYSFDGGATWQSSSALQVTSNGTYSVQVRDKVGNATGASVEISQIDQTQPEVSYQTSPALADWYDGDLTILVTASDGQSGLSAAPYSFDGGATYLVNGSYTINKNSSLDIVVRDQAGNTRHTQAVLNRRIRPTAAVTPVPTQNPGAAGGASGASEQGGITGGASGASGQGGITGVGTGGTGQGGTGGGASGISEKNETGTGGKDGADGTSGLSGQSGVGGKNGASGQNGTGDKNGVSGQNGAGDTGARGEESPRGMWEAGVGSSPQKILDTVYGDQRAAVKEEWSYELPSSQETPEDLILEEETSVVELPEFSTDTVISATVIRQRSTAEKLLMLMAVMTAVLSGTAALGLALWYIRFRFAVTGMVYAGKDNGRYRYLSLVPIRVVQEQPELVLTERMLRSAQTTLFRIRVSQRSLQHCQKLVQQAGDASGCQLCVRYKRLRRTVRLEQDIRLEL